MVDRKTIVFLQKEMKKENKNEVKFCVYCGKEIKNYEDSGHVETKRKTERWFHIECYLKTTMRHKN